MMKNINKITKIIKILFFFAVTILIFYLIFRKIDYFSVKEVLLNAQWRYLVAATLVIFLMVVFAAKKWQAMMGAISYSLDFKDSFKMIMATFPISAITPAKSGDLIKSYYLKNKVPVTQTTGAVITERFIDIFVLALYSLIGAAVFKNRLILIISLSVIFFIPLFFLVVNNVKIPAGKWREKIENFLYISKIFIHQPKKLLPVLFYASMLWLISFLEVKILFLALGADVSFFHIAAALPPAIFIGLIPVTIAGMGTRDSVIIYFFSPWVESSICLGVGLLYSFFTYWLLALLGLPIMKKMLYNKQNAHFRKN